MAVKEIIKVWDNGEMLEENIKILMTPTKPVSFPLNDKEKVIISDLIDSYNKIECAGIAANQIGYKKRIFIGKKDDSDNYSDYAIFINPQIDKVNEDSMQLGPEGCLSIPDLSLNIDRYDKITVRYYNEDGKRKTMKLSGFISRLFQHEIEHLNGKLMIGGKVHSGTSSGSAINDLFYDLVKLLFGETICPFYEKNNVVPFSDKHKHTCNSKHLNGNCQHMVDLYCNNSARTYMNCQYYDKDSVL
jgi:peptide deformylase